MAGYIVKVTLENTHPPVWRRLIIPEKITFEDLHRILQTAFQWEDEHLHEFTLPGMGIRIGMEQKDDMADAEEGQVQVDGFWRICKNIRYTYDFGDDWNHKIAFEKEEPEYHSRFAVVLKYRGDSFREDSGGVWNAYDGNERIPFEQEIINKRLVEMPFPVREESEESAELLKNAAVGKIWKSIAKKNREKLVEMGNKLLRSLGNSQELQAERPLSEAAERVQRWRRFCETKDFEKLQNVLKNVSTRSSMELLTQLDSKESRNYCKYIGALPEDKDDIGLCAKAFWEELEQHPEYLGYLFTWEELEQLMELLQAPNTVMDKVPEQDMITKALALGFFDLSEEKVNNNRYMALRQTADAERLLARHTKSEWRRISKEHRRRIEKANRLLNLYTMMELDVFCEKYQKYFEKNTSREEILRCVYLGGTFCKEIQTAETTDGISYIAEYYVDMNRVLTEQRDLGVKQDYRDFSRQEIEKASEGYGALYPEWAGYFDYLMECYDMDAEETEDWLQEDYQDIRNGEGAEALWESVREAGMLASIDCYTTFWNYFFGICLNTGIPKLKGYSRAEYGVITGTSLEELGIYRHFKAAETVTERTHLYEMPLELQMRLYSILQHSKNGKSIAELEELHRGFKNGNYELEYLMAGGFILAEVYEKAERVMKRLAKAFPKDEAVREIQKNLKLVMQYGAEEELSVWDMLDGKTLKSRTETYYRDQPKIGRNDPCPCGSGKKYKKCCGR